MSAGRRLSGDSDQCEQAVFVFRPFCPVRPSPAGKWGLNHPSRNRSPDPNRQAENCKKS